MPTGTPKNRSDGGPIQALLRISLSGNCILSVLFVLCFIWGGSRVPEANEPAHSVAARAPGVGDADSSRAIMTRDSESSRRRHIERDATLIPIELAMEFFDSALNDERMLNGPLSMDDTLDYLGRSLHLSEHKFKELSSLAKTYKEAYQRLQKENFQTYESANGDLVSRVTMDGPGLANFRSALTADLQALLGDDAARLCIAQTMGRVGEDDGPYTVDFTIEVTDDMLLTCYRRNDGLDIFATDTVGRNHGGMAKNPFPHLFPNELAPDILAAESLPMLLKKLDQNEDSPPSHPRPE